MLIDLPTHFGEHCARRARAGNPQTIQTIVGDPQHPFWHDLERHLGAPAARATNGHRILQPAGSELCPEMNRFGVAERYKVNLSENAAVKVSRVSEKFLEHFGAVTEMAPAGTVQAFDLLDTSPDEAILTALGTVSSTPLAHLWHLLCLQHRGADGLLLTGHRSNVCYALDAHRHRMAVCVVWDGTGWGITARPALPPHTWDSRTRVLRFS